MEQICKILSLPCQLQLGELDLRPPDEIHWYQVYCALERCKYFSTPGYHLTRDQGSRGTMGTLHKLFVVRISSTCVALSAPVYLLHCLAEKIVQGSFGVENSNILRPRHAKLPVWQSYMRRKNQSKKHCV